MSDKDGDYGDEFKYYSLIQFQINNPTEQQPEQQQEQEQSNSEKPPPILEKQAEAEFETNSEKPSMAEMTGYIPDESEVENKNKIEIEETEANEAYLVTTKGNVFDRVGAKTSIVASATLAVVLIFGLTGQFLTTIFNNKDKPQEVAQIPTKAVEQDNEESIDKLKTNSAIASLQAEMRRKAEQELLNSKIPASTPTPKPTTATPQSVSKVVTVTAEPTPISKYKTVAKPKRQIPEPAPESVETVPPIQVATPSVNSPTSSNPDQNKGVSKVSKTKERKLGTPQASNSTLSISTQNNEYSLIVGTRAPAKLETAIVWSRVGAIGNPQSSYSTKDAKPRTNHVTYPIKLTQALKNPDGTVIIPKGSLLITQVKSVLPEGWINLSVVSIVANFGSGTTEKAVSESVILVQARDGSPLKANIKTLPQSNKDDGTGTFPGISRISRLPVRHGIDPANNESIRRLASEQEINHNNSNSKQSTPNIRVFTLNKDASVQIYINRSFDLSKKEGT
jgi:hypothetical protein